jgi:putative aldouronate transport system substrate-binding protein
MADGIIPSENLTQDQNQVITLINSPEVRVFGIPRASVGPINVNNPARDEYIFIPPLRGPRGIQYTMYRPSVAMISLMVSSRCKNPDAAFRVGDFITSRRMNRVNRLGEEGVNWDWPENVKNISDYTSRITDLPVSVVVHKDPLSGTEPTNATWLQVGPRISLYRDGSSEGVNKGAANYNFEMINGKAWELYQEGGYKPREVIPKLLYTLEELEATADILITLKNYVAEMTSSFIAGNRDIDASWNGYIGELNSIGLPKVLATVQKVYDRMYK